MTPRPGLTFASTSTQSALGGAYRLALANLLDVNTVPYQPSGRTSGLASGGSIIQAGIGYAGQAWTRDGAVNAWNAGSLLEPEAAATTLWAAVTRQPDGSLIVTQDSQWWDQVIWATAAWHHYLATGDQPFLVSAYQTVTNTLARRRRQNFNAAHGLFEGPAFFNDGIAGYPAPPADPAESQGSFVGDYPAARVMMTLSTNCLYHDAYRSAALMAAELGRPASEAAALSQAADALKTAVNQHLWDPGTGRYGYFIHGDGPLAGQLDPTEEGAGLSFAILFGIASPAQAQSIMRQAHVQPYGITGTYPSFPRYSDTRPGRHNELVWPVVQGFWAEAAAIAGDIARFESEVRSLAGLASASGQFAEIYNARTGAVDGGWQTVSGGFPASRWPSEPDQTWSATAYLRMIHAGLFGLRLTTDGITFAPTLPPAFGDATLSGIGYRGASLTIALHGAGNVIGAFSIDGAPAEPPALPASVAGHHTIDITLTG
jgi:hypothetical protein